MQRAMLPKGLQHPGQNGRWRCSAARAKEPFVFGKKVRTQAASTSTTTTTITTTTTDAKDVDPVRRGPMTAAHIRDHKTLFRSLLSEYEYCVEDSWVTGTIPPEMYGTYYRNGPGLQIENPRYKRHTFDGDGMVISLAFRGGRVYFRNRFVRTEGFVKEQEAGKPLFRNAFTRGAADGSLLFNPLDMTFKNVANTGVLPWAGKLYALWEAGLPHSLDPVTLDTQGLTDLDGAVREKALAAHYRITPPTAAGQPTTASTAPSTTTTPITASAQQPSLPPDARLARGSGGAGASGEGRRLVAFSPTPGLIDSSVTIYEFDETGRKLHETKQVLKGASLAFIHDVLVTEHYYIVVQGPVELSGSRFLTDYLFGRASIAQCLQFVPGKPTHVIMMPRPGRPSGRVLPARVLTAPASFSFHHCNAFEVERIREREGQEGVGQPLVVLDTIETDTFDFSSDQCSYGPEYFTGGSRPRFTRLICDPIAGTVTPYKLMRRTGEFPCVDPRVTGRTHTHIWATCDAVDDPLYWGPAQAIVRLTVDPRLGLPGGPMYGRGTGDGGGEETATAGGVYGTAEGVNADIWYAGDRRFPGEPMFVPRPGSDLEGDGWLVVTVHDAATEKGEVVILNAMDLAAGPVATIRLPHRLPAGLHGCWHNRFTGPEETPGTPGGAPRWRLLGTARAL